MKVQDLITELNKLDQDAEVLAHWADKQKFEVNFVIDMKGAFVSLQLDPVTSKPSRRKTEHSGPVPALWSKRHWDS